MKILVTGCAGFIGFHLTKRLLAEGHTVTGIDNLNHYYQPELKLARLERLGIDPTQVAPQEILCAPSCNFTFVKADIDSEWLYREFLDPQAFDVVCHLAAQAGVRYSFENPQQYVSSNIQGFFNILEYCRRNRPQKLVYASSSSVYGSDSRIPYREDEPCNAPVSLYAATKKSNEAFAHSYAEMYGIRSVGLRFFTVYGPWGRPDMAPFLFTKAILEGDPIRVFNDGNMSRDFTYIDDIVEGIYRVLTGEPAHGSPENYRIYNIGCSHPVPLNDFIRTIERLSGKTARRIDQPMQPGDVKDTWADVSRLERDYGYSPGTSLEKGLAEFLAWYTECYATENSARCHPQWAVSL
ncbi:MAG: NAD-dependent epimerase/dehydratase family protein [Rikenellaceae bacterium]|nr:NAD-dependent epimerase/dehydratase family protein [Rikenellaceae bacterium]